MFSMNANPSNFHSLANWTGNLFIFLVRIWRAILVGLELYILMCKRNENFTNIWLEIHGNFLGLY